MKTLPEKLKTVTLSPGESEDAATDQVLPAGSDMQKRIHLLLIFLCVSLFLCPAAGAQSSEEMRMLELFYEKKDLVITPTRYPKPINQVAENITVITSEEIEAMNAHTVAEVLRWAPGVLVNTSLDFGATSLIGIQGSEDRHVTVLLDGIRWNYLSGGNAETNTIPTGIIDRIEIIKGPASSAWGSSLGGVINIITKRTGWKKTPRGSLQLSYGESGSLDASTQTYGKVNTLGYYIYVGRQESGGLRDNRDMDTKTFFSKVDIDLSRKADLSFSLGYSEPENDLGSFPSGDIRSDSDSRALHVNTALNLDLTPRSTLTVSGYYLSQDLNLDSNALGLGYVGTAGDFYLNSDYNEENYGAVARVVWEPPHHTVVMGAELNQGNLEQAFRTGDFLQAYGAPVLSRTKPDMLSWAGYVNDTIPLGKWTVTPGVRFDHNTVSGSFFSPSLGVTFQPENDTLFRGTISRGFQSPPLSFSEGGSLFLDSNPDLDAEEVWAYQAGFETTALPMVRVKTTLFLYDLADTIDRELYAGGPPSYNDLYLNSQDLQRRGVEVEFKTDPILNVSLEALGTYIHFDTANGVGATELWTGNLILSYDAPNAVTARLGAHFEDLNSAAVYNSNFDSVIWDFTIKKTLSLGESSRTTLFMSVHNLFDGSQYGLDDTKNPSRWIEGGIRFAY